MPSITYITTKKVSYHCTLFYLPFPIFLSLLLVLSLLFFLLSAQDLTNILMPRPPIHQDPLLSFFSHPPQTFPLPLNTDISSLFTSPTNSTCSSDPTGSCNTSYLLPLMTTLSDLLFDMFYLQIRATLAFFNA